MHPQLCRQREWCSTLHTRIHPDNPHSRSRYGFAWEHVPQGTSAHLDYGCFDGAFLGSLGGKDAGRLVGVDVSGDAIERARRMHPQVEFRQITPDAPLPFDDQSFTSITVLDVIEHMYDQKLLLDELNRILTPDGLLIVTVPKRHCFSFLDMGNLKFRFPRLHRWVFTLRHSRGEYERRYVSNLFGLVGDISARKMWHEHFTPDGLSELLQRSGFSTVVLDGSGLFARLINVAFLPLCWCSPVMRLARRLSALDARCFKSMNLFLVAAKQHAVGDGVVTVTNAGQADLDRLPVEVESAGGKRFMTLVDVAAGRTHGAIWDAGGAGITAPVGRMEYYLCSSSP